MSKKFLPLIVVALLLLAGLSCKCHKEDKAKPPEPQPYLGVEGERCEDLISGLIVPHKDMQTFDDQEYPEVTITSREYWDQKRLPERVVNLEMQGYECTPLPVEWDDTAQPPGMNVERGVMKVEWNCELSYANFQVIDPENLESKQMYEEMGHTCEQRECIDQGSESFVFLCHTD